MRRFGPLIVLGLMVANVHGDGITTVTLDGGFPDKALPIGSDFYIQGTVSKDIKSITPIFVRYSYGGWGIPSRSDASGCIEVTEVLSDFRGKDNKVSKVLPANLQGGNTPISDIWIESSSRKTGRPHTVYSHLAEWHSAYVGTIWKPDPKPPTDASASSTDAGAAATSDPKVQYKILIPASTFFRPGARYCLFVYADQDKVTGESDIVAAVAGFAKGWRTCKSNDKPCQQKAVDDLGKKITDVTGALNDTQKKAVNEIKNNDIFNWALTDLPIWNLPDEWLAPRAKGDVSSWRSVAEDPFSSALVELLARNTKDVLPVVDTKNKVVRFYTDDGKVVLNQIMLLGNSQNLRVSADAKSAKPATRSVVSVSLDKLVLPDFDDVSMQDLVSFVQGKIRINGKDVALNQLSTSAPLKPLNDAIKANQYPPPTAALTSAATFEQRLARLVAVLNRAFEASVDRDGMPPLSVAADAIYSNLGQWLRDSVRKCDDLKLSGVDCPAAHNAWPGFAERTNSVTYLDTQLRHYLDAANGWNKAKANLESALKVEATTTLSTVEAKMTVTQNTWFFNYVTPITGYAVAMPKGGSNFGMPYIGIELYFYPNLVNEPMWTNGFYDDLKRVLSLELAIALQNGPFGADGRFSGIGSSNLPPLFVGVGLQLIPYVTFSAGAIFMGHRSSTLTQEAPSLFVSPYLGATVQINIPDLVKAAVGRTTTTTALTSTTTTGAK